MNAPLRYGLTQTLPVYFLLQNSTPFKINWTNVHYLLETRDALSSQLITQTRTDFIRRGDDDDKTPHFYYHETTKKVKSGKTL